MDFRDIIGQEDVVRGLQYAVGMDRVGHAYAFCGPQGIGKRTIAGIFAGVLLCEAPVGGESCKACQACRLYAGEANPDFRRIMADGASIGVDEIRDIQSDVVIKPMYSKRKVYIIENADKMTVQAQNSLLKTLEEPPHYVTIILTVSNYEALLETIRSRSQRISFRKNSYAQVRQAVINKYGSQAEGIDFAVSYADGVIGSALELAGSEEFVALREKIFEITGQLRNQKLFDIFGVHSYFEENKDDFDVILDIMTMIFRDMLVVKEVGNENILINSDKKDIIFNNARRYSPRQLISGIEQIEVTRRAVKQNANFQLAVEHMLMKLQEGT